MNVTIKNEFLTVQISSHGAEIQSVKDCGGKEWIWSGDENIWSGKAPVLFPVCGGLKDDKYTLSGKEYFMVKHGFARTSEFEVLSEKETCAEFLLKSDEDTKKSYPYEFEFKACFSVEENMLKVVYEINNLSDDKMYFAVGAHEAYACPEGVENYGIIFEDDEYLEHYDAGEGPIADTPVKIELESNMLNLSDDMFERDALVFKGLKSRKAVLLNKLSGEKAELDFDGFDYFLVWKKTVGNYVCLEPWTCPPYSVSAKYAIEEKEGIKTVESGEKYSVEHTIKFGE